MTANRTYITYRVFYRTALGNKYFPLEPVDQTVLSATGGTFNAPNPSDGPGNGLLNNTGFWIVEVTNSAKTPDTTIYDVTGSLKIVLMDSGYLKLIWDLTKGFVLDNYNYPKPSAVAVDVLRMSQLDLSPCETDSAEVPAKGEFPQSLLYPDLLLTGYSNPAFQNLAGRYLTFVNGAYHHSYAYKDGSISITDGYRTFTNPQKLANAKESVTLIDTAPINGYSFYSVTDGALSEVPSENGCRAVLIDIDKCTQPILNEGEEIPLKRKLEDSLVCLILGGVLFFPTGDNFNVSQKGLVVKLDLVMLKRIFYVSSVMRMYGLPYDDSTPKRNPLDDIDDPSLDSFNGVDYIPDSNLYNFNYRALFQSPHSGVLLFDKTVSRMVHPVTRETNDPTLFKIGSYKPVNRFPSIICSAGSHISSSPVMVMQNRHYRGDPTSFTAPQGLAPTPVLGYIRAPAHDDAEEYSYGNQFRDVAVSPLFDIPDKKRYSNLEVFHLENRA